MLPLLPAIALHAGQPEGLILPQRQSIIMPTNDELAQFDPALGMLPFPSPLLFGSGGVPAGTFLLGANNAPTANTGLAGDFQLGSGFQATVSGTANNIVIMGSTAAANPTLVFRLCVWAATSVTVWSGALLGKTADQTGLGQNQILSIPLIAPVSIVNGSFYALTIHCSSAASGSTAAGGTGANDRFVGDTFSDGPASPIGASGLNAAAGRIIYLTT
jgi:hypothetical protein